VRITSTLDTSSFHEPVMLSEVLSFLAPERGGLYLDGTLGGGGHARAILDSTLRASLLALDRDPEALDQARAALAVYGDRVALRQGDYLDAGSVFDLGEGALAGVLLDLGVSSHQIDSEARGFSFRPGIPLDMRMSGSGVTAEELLATLPADSLAEIFRSFGEERRARRLAAAIVERRSCSRLRTSDDLVTVIEAVWGRPPAASDLARIFQALRIGVNQELDSLERALPVLRDLLMPGGRIVVIAYHSLEDRLVKRSFRDWSRDCVCPPGIPVCRCRGRPLGHELNRGPLRPTADEVAHNPRARSALLRAWERGE
jgi:16S rRNA (cytosine1402-N4)-methyltransferase